MASKASHIRYNKSEKGRARQRRYAASDKRRIANLRWAHSEKKRAIDRRYRSTEHGIILRHLFDSRPDVKLRKQLHTQERMH